MTTQTIVGEVIVTILQLAMTGLIVPALAYFIKWIRGKMQENLGEELAAWIENAVWAAQQTITGNEEKKAYVLNKTYQWLQEHGLNIDEEDLNMLIEATVLTMKNELSNKKKVEA